MILRYSSRHLAVGVALLLSTSFLVLENFAQDMPGNREAASQTARDLSQRAQQLQSENRWQESISLRQQAIEVLSKAFGEENPEVDALRFATADALMTIGRYPEARSLFEKCLTFRRSVREDSAKRFIAEALNRIGESFRREGSLQKALQQYKLAEDELAGWAPGISFLMPILHNRALALQATDDLLGAEQIWLNLSNAKEKLGQIDIQFAIFLTSLGEIHRALGRLSQAEGEHLRALSILANLHPRQTFRILAENNIAAVYRDQGRTQDAISIYERNINYAVEQSGADSVEVLTTRRNLARTFAEEHRHAKALEIIDDCLTRLEKTKKTEVPLFTILLTDRADRLSDLGDARTARDIYESIIRNSTPQNGTDDSKYWTARERHAVLTRETGDLEAAKKNFDEIIAFRRKKASESPKSVENLISTLLEEVRFERALGRPDEAIHKCAELLDLATNRLSLIHYLNADILSQLGFLSSKKGQTEKAISDHEKALFIRQKLFGDRSLHAAQSRLNLGHILVAKTNTIESAKVHITTAYETICKLAAPESALRSGAEVSMANLLHRLKDFKGARPHYEFALASAEKMHTQIAGEIARDFAFLELDSKNPSRALELAVRASEYQQNHFQNVLRFGSESDRLGWRGERDVFSALASATRENAAPLATALLRLKGAVLDSLIEDSQLSSLKSDLASKNDIRDLRKARSERFRLEMMSSGKGVISSERLRSAREQVELLESKLAEKITSLGFNRSSLNITFESVQKSLPTNSALLEFVRYQHWLPEGETEPHFGVVIITKEGNPRWVDLGLAGPKSPITSGIEDWQTALKPEIPPSEKVVTNLLQNLHDSIWAPISKALPPNAKEIIVSPDGEINFVSFASLWNKDQFLGETFSFRYVASGRDLAFEAPLTNQKTVGIIAAPEYARSTWERRVVSPLQSSVAAIWKFMGLRGGPLKPSDLKFYADLPGTMAEGQMVERLCKENGLSPEPILHGKAATEASLDGFVSPYILHFATHGTFLTGESESPKNQFDKTVVYPSNPMHRSWLVLARGNETIGEWRNGNVPDPGTDGLFSSDEAAQLRLKGTWLVTMSACDTGLGNAATGEGVFGLRRGFALAGAKNVLMTLWPINDSRTRIFMEAFYADALKSKDAPGALARVQRKLLSEWKTSKTDGPGRAARFAGAFVISSRGQ